ncbi:hypothetical protein FEDK69T_29970 [Flavobacterium enshiense DK69]|uniref:Copper amine oxidase catalytic domain-containing protein n=1 Tax=Flavobacterium enshiense DK69 TaxID=1107311 RepID=V6S247_9FLAO|nr:hypothetical protein [Flavobacterium enshiense]ESU20474.1 hypothetical protein FEDK69T_29970 [Flavobacterium enshiense DK69]KGO95722.1 hypothetical protein Q767_08485 [Flavobacterium enshiense DK69]
MKNDLEIKFRTVASVSDEQIQSIIDSPSVNEYLKGCKYRILSTHFFDRDKKEKDLKECQSNFSDFNQITVYNYTHNRCLLIKIKSWKTKAVEITESVFQPEPNDEEFEEAVNLLLKKHKDIKTYLDEKSVRIYKPMPPTLDIPLPDGEIQRTVNVGISSDTKKIRNEIVGVNMITHDIHQFENGAPFGAHADSGHCGLPDANQPTTNRGTSGKCWVTVTQAGKVIWKFLVIRPSASSGTKGSGIELKYVDYKGKRVLYQAHVPILNVLYDIPPCGPFRDWQHQEGMFNAVGKDIAPGIRLCSTPATTILDTDNDSGNFKGVAIYVKGQEVVLVSEMEAGWYRYVSEWRLHADGTIRPRFGFGAVQNSCVCNKHHHHVYWRFDFDIETPGNNLVQEFNDPILVGNSKWHNKSFEIRRPKDSSRKRKWKISNTRSGSAYEIIPGDKDGKADSFGVGDLWVLRYHGGSEIDDGITVVGGTPAQCMAHIDKFVNGESIVNKDVVVWYAAHFTHDLKVETGHIVGPTLKCVKW